MDIFIQQLLNGLTLGGVYALIALGYTMVYGILKLINFAHGEIFMVGAFVGYFSIVFIVDFFIGTFVAGYIGLSPETAGSIKDFVLNYRFIISIICTVLCCSLLGLFVERVAYRPLRDGSPRIVIGSAIGLACVVFFAIISTSHFELGYAFLFIILSICLSFATIAYIRYLVNNMKVLVKESFRNKSVIYTLLYAACVAVIVYLAWYYDVLNLVIYTFIFIMLVYWLVNGRVKGSSTGDSNSRINALISALGMSMIISNLVMVIYGSGKLSYPVLIEGSYTYNSISISYLQLFIIIFSFILMAMLFYIIHKTRFGLAMRAVSYNLNAARLMGINPDKIIAVTFVLGSSLAGIAGIIVGTYYRAADYQMGMLYGMKAFVAAVLGGIGSIPGAVTGGIILGIAETVGAAYISLYKDAIAFGILILILVIKPAGIFGRSVKEKV